MLSTTSLNCLFHGHINRTVKNQGSVYTYCLRCGKLSWRHTHLTATRSKARAIIPESVGNPA